MSEKLLSGGVTGPDVFGRTGLAWIGSGLFSCGKTKWFHLVCGVQKNPYHDVHLVHDVL